jgi:hypothetical protein
MVNWARANAIFDTNQPGDLIARAIAMTIAMRRADGWTIAARPIGRASRDHQWSYETASWKSSLLPNAGISGVRRNQ